MRKILYLKIMLCAINIIVSKNSFAQVIRIDSGSQQNAHNNAVTLLYSSLGNQAAIYNGTEYFFYDPSIKGNAYFSDIKTFTSGSVYYDGSYYNDVPMLYDLYTDQVVALLYNHFTMYSLIKERVASFDLMNHHFINITSDTVSEKSGLKPGFYDQIYAGKSKILVKREKTIQTNLSAESSFSGATNWFLQKNNIFYDFGNKAALLNLLKDKKKELKQYINTNQIEFRANPEGAMVKIVSFYDHLTN